MIRITADQVYKIWKQKNMGAIPRIEVDSYDGYFIGKIILKEEEIGSGNDCSRHRDALNSAKRHRAYVMAGKMFPGQEVWVE